MYRIFCLLLVILILSCQTEDTLRDKANTTGQLNDTQSVGASLGDSPDVFPEGMDWLREAQSAWFEKKDPDLTDYCLDRVNSSALNNEGDRALYQLLCRKVYTRMLPLKELGFADANISSLFLDRDDLWIGTWAGGIVRYSLPLEELATLRPSRDSIRVEKISDFERVGTEIRLAGYSDLYSYDRTNSRLDRQFPKDMERINNLAWFKGTLFASTVDKGLWYEGESGEWYPIGEHVPGLSRINALYIDSRGYLLIGTASAGIIRYDGNSFTSFREIYPRFKGRNITAFTESGDLLIVGSYGEGGFIINRQSGESWQFSKEKGDFLSDYLLCATVSEKWFYVGTLGGGVYALPVDSEGSSAEWIALGMDEGLYSLDTSAIIPYENSIYVSLLGHGVLILDEEIIEKAL
ncbi:MAG: hypothetical protein PQJ59_10605 [Spirochaetales bacterium]|nr:hypothetical protein [Spirochaetales bacterium]